MNNSKIGSTTNISKILFNLWGAFSLSLLVYLTPIVLSNIVGIFFYPIIALILSFVVYVIINWGKKYTSNQSECLLPLSVMLRVMITYGVVMLYINFNVLRPDSIIDMMELDKSVHFYYYPVLLLSLITIFYIPYSTKKIFTFRISRKSLPDGNRIYRSFQENVTTNVMRSLLIICFVVAMAGWIYFFILYNSANINTFDRLIFTGVPILVALIHSVTLSIIFLSYIYHKDLLHRVTPYIPNKSILRFIIVSDDNLLLQLKNDGTYDTPVVITIPFSENIDLSKLEEILNEKYNINPKSIKLLFSKDDKSFNSNINLYLCKVDKDAKVSIPNNLAWITTSQLENINSERKLSVLLNNELYRIFGTMLAYKEFDEDGNCRYKVKGYHPTVTIADISRYDIDYNDNKWMTLFSINHSKSLISKLRLIRYKYFKTSIH